MEGEEPWYLVSIKWAQKLRFIELGRINGGRSNRKDWGFEERQESGVSQGLRKFESLVTFHRVAKIRNPCEIWPSTCLKTGSHQKKLLQTKHQNHEKEHKKVKKLQLTIG